MSLLLTGLFWVVVGPVAHIVWQPSSGPVVAYLVLDEAGVELARVAEPEALVPCGADEQRVRVVAVDANDTRGHASEPSDPYKCLGWYGWQPDANGDALIGLPDFGAFAPAYGGQVLR